MAKALATAKAGSRAIFKVKIKAILMAATRV
jgi:hypothetical protein